MESLNPRTITVLSWNISFAYGLGSDGLGYVPQPREHFDRNLETIAQVIRRSDADAVLLQEVDFDSHRSHRIHQLEVLAEKTGYPYRAACESWNCAFVPFPGLNPWRHFGKVRSGGGILSRSLIRENRVELLPKPKAWSAIYRFFYPSRYLQQVQIDGHWITNLHLEAFDAENRQLHLDRLRAKPRWIAGGDFNQDPGPDFVTSPQVLAATPEPTFPAADPTRSLDHLIYDSESLRLISIEVLKTGAESDHRPLLAKFTPLR